MSGAEKQEIDEINRSQVYFSGRLVVGCCGDKFSVAKASILFPQHRKFVGCYLNLDCVASSLLQLDPMFSCQVSCNESDITENDGV